MQVRDCVGVAFPFLPCIGGESIQATPPCDGFDYDRDDDVDLDDHAIFHRVVTGPQ